ncbi:MAG: hypothetical protein JNM71_13995 [Flavobacterium lindanitolerans]|uniref:hypothetical protein n=1 Tax=Flavobacterium lindanitolerans TaxID=428988 RepID=UPI001A3AE24A|nr:hypothetical protein [Flavobacterium lindanitolerans]MBL7869124.1 hypothetical protein [Flavobacterium lindanitolerans]
MKRDLPIINIHGTDFRVDIEKLQLTEKINEKNVIPFGYMRDVSGGYEFDYGLESRNIRNIWTDEESVRVTIPSLAELDPIGISQKYNVPMEQLKGKTDFEIMVDQQAFDLRVNKGVLPTINIAGDVFYVVLDKERLIPKDNPASEGIPLPSFGQYDQVLGENVFAYDPKKREITELDYLKITEIPKNLIAIRLPFSFTLDPVGWNLITNRDVKFGLKTSNLKMQFNAPQISWEKTDLPDIIKENMKGLRQKQTERMKQSSTKPIINKQKRGRRL